MGALTLTKETGTSSTSSNAYANHDDALSYSYAHLYAAALQNNSQQTVEAALVWSTRLLDELVEWHGSRTDIDQALEWPRIGVKDKNGVLYDINEMPTWLVDATCELARQLLAADRTADDFAGPRGYSRMQVDTLALDIDKFDRVGMLPDSVRAIVQPYGTVTGRGATTVRLLRA